MKNIRSAEQAAFSLALEIGFLTTQLNGDNLNEMASQVFLKENITPPPPPKKKKKKKKNRIPFKIPFLAVYNFGRQ